MDERLIPACKQAVEVDRLGCRLKRLLEVEVEKLGVQELELEECQMARLLHPSEEDLLEEEFLSNLLEVLEVAKALVSSLLAHLT